MEKHIWQQSPKPITSFVSEETADVIVLGAGIAGCAAAQSAAEAGASVICVEKFGRFTAHGIDVGSVNTKIQKKMGIHIDPCQAARLVYAWSQQQANYSLIRTYTQRSGEVLDHYIDMMEDAGYTVTLNTEMTARADWSDLDDRYKMFRTAHIFDVPEGSSLPKERWGAAYLVRTILKSAEAFGARFMYNTKAEQLICGDGGVTGVIVSDKEGCKKLNARKGVIIATGGITDNEEMKECFCPISLRADKNENFPRGGNMGDGLVMGKWIGASFSRCYPAPIIHPVNFTPLGPGINTSWLTVDRRGERFCNEMGYEPCVTNARMNAPGNVAYAIWDKDYMANYKKQEPIKFAGLKPGTEQAVEQAVRDGVYFKADTLDALAGMIGVPAARLENTVARYNQLCANEDDVDFGVPARFLSPVLNGPFYATKITAWLLSLPYGLHVDANSQVCRDDDSPINGLFAVGNAQGDFFANSYPVTLPGTSHGRSICFGRLVGQALALDKHIDGSPLNA